MKIQILGLTVFLIVFPQISLAGTVVGIEGDLPIWAKCNSESFTENCVSVYDCEVIPSVMGKKRQWVEVEVSLGGILAIQIENEVTQHKLRVMGMTSNTIMMSSSYLLSLAYENPDGTIDLVSAITMDENAMVAPRSSRQSGLKDSILLIHWVDDGLGGKLRFKIRVISPDASAKDVKEEP